MREIYATGFSGCEMHLVFGEKIIANIQAASIREFTGAVLEGEEAPKIIGAIIFNDIDDEEALTDPDIIKDIRMVWKNELGDKFEEFVKDVKFREKPSTETCIRFSADSITEGKPIKGEEG